MKINLFSSADRSLKVFLDNKQIIKNKTYFWMFFDWNIHLLSVNDGRTNSIGQNERLLHVAIYLKQVRSDFTDF